MPNRITVTVEQEQGYEEKGPGTFVKVEPAAVPLEELVNADIDGFAKFFCDKLGNDSLADGERAIIKTYLWYKTHPTDDPSKA